MASIVYNAAKGAFADGSLNWESDTIRILLLSSIDTVDADHTSLAAVLGPSGNTEVSTPNYSRQTLDATTVTVDDENDRAIVDADDVLWANVGDGTVEAVSALLYKQVGGDDTTPATDLPIALIDLTDTVLNGGDFTIQWSSQGIVTLS